MRRALALSALALALVLPTAACGAGSPAAGGARAVTITWWDTSNAGNEAPTYQALVKDFEAANPGIGVRYVNVPFDQAQSRFRAAAHGKGAPDVLRCEVGWTAEFARAGMLVPLDGTPALDDRADFRPSLLAQAKYGDRTYGAPLVTDTLALLYNKSALGRAGITRPPATWKELRADAGRIQRTSGMAGFTLRADSYYALPFFYGEGTNLVDAADRRITVDSAAAVRAVDTARELLDSPGVTKLDTTADGYAHMQDAFDDGRVAMIVQGPWELTNVFRGTAFADPTNLGIAPVPAGSAGRSGSPTGGHNLVAYAGSDAAHRAAAEKFIGFMTSATVQTRIALKNGTLPTRFSAYTEAVMDDPGIAGYQGVLSTAQPRPELPEYSLLFAPLTSNYNRILGGAASTRAGLDATAAEYRKLLPGFSG
ncbi:extracellular solute-binding protein [Streptacidiphilus griseoplanus]|uniref:extracellular solute-binding protein n=1 Tax=Peterkaempfera griseoplana TaxID=66896 RepID=UPI0006E3E196|nr:extracellular solute-binding protein [Peterkaempfera griseoplana]